MKRYVCVGKGCCVVDVSSCEVEEVTRACQAKICFQRLFGIVFVLLNHININQYLTLSTFVQQESFHRFSSSLLEI